MKLIVGLGNPEGRYAKTRHNAGFMVVDAVVSRFAKGEPFKARFKSACVEANLPGPSGPEKTLLMKPTTYMNLSGQAVAEAVAFYKLDPAKDMLVVVDDLYLPVGAIRIRPAGGSGGHNGLSDIDRLLARQDYPRLRVGVGLKPNGGKPPLMDQADFVLSQFTSEEWPDLESALNRAAEAAEIFVAKGLSAAMNKHNASDGGKAA